MNLKRIIWTSCFAAVVLTASFALGQPHRGGGHFNSMPMRGGQTFSHGGMGTWSGRNWNGGNWSGRNWNGRNWSGRNWSGGNWSGRNWSGRNWSGGNWGGNQSIFIGGFGFPFFYGYPYYGSYPYGYGSYPYGYGYDSSYGYGYDNYSAPAYGYGYYGNQGYGYGNQGRGNDNQANSYGDRSSIEQLQRRLARAGYYHGAIDGIMGPETRRAIRAYERDHNMPAYGLIDRQLLTTMGL